jgi:uncharacterized phiE125 gp8 family phage protein
MALCQPDAVVTYAALADPDWEALEAIVERASAAVEDYCACRFTQASCDELYDVGPQQAVIILRSYPVITLSALYDGLRATSAGRQLAPSQYILDPQAGLVRLRTGFFTPGPGSVRAIYTAGYAQPPAAVVQAVIMLAADWYRNRPDGRALAESYDGYTARYAPEALPPAVARLLAPYRRRRLA